MCATIRPKPYDRATTGELNVEALGGSYGRQSSWGDPQPLGSSMTDGLHFQLA